MIPKKLKRTSFTKATGVWHVWIASPCYFVCGLQYNLLYFFPVGVRDAVQVRCFSHRAGSHWIYRHAASLVGRAAVCLRDRTFLQLRFLVLCRAYATATNWLGCFFFSFTTAILPNIGRAFSSTPMTPRTICIMTILSSHTHAHTQTPHHHQPRPSFHRLLTYNVSRADVF